MNELRKRVCNNFNLIKQW